MFRIYSNDHYPSHVHVFKAGEEVVINVCGEDTAPFLQKNNGMSNKDAMKALEIVAENQDHFLTEWRNIHG